MPSSSSPQGPGSSKAAVLPLDLLDVTVTSFDEQTRVANLEVRGVTLEVRQPGRFYLQPVMAGVAGTIGGDILIERYSSQTAAAVAAEYAIRIGITLVVSVMAVGNSAWHSPAIAVPFSIIVTVGAGGGIVAFYDSSHNLFRLSYLAR